MDLENKYGMREMHTALLKMLSDFNDICKHHGVTYSLGFGSMLGGVREHGIIPWDDDIDVIIDRANYYKLERALEGSDTFWVERNTVKTLWLPRFRYKEKKNVEFDYELTIDLFIIDNVPDNEMNASLKLFMIHFLQGMIKGKPNMKKGGALLKTASLTTFLLGRLFPMSFKFRLYDRVSAISNSKKTNSCSCYNAEYLYAGRRYDGRLLDEVKEVDFDNVKAPISKQYDSYLTVLYGDYMTPPEKKDRVPKHS